MTQRIVFVVLLLVSALVNAEPAFHRLHNQYLTLELTPSLGGRITHFSLPGEDNVLNVVEKNLRAEEPPVGLEYGHFDVRGHIVWLAPQSAWWRRQDLNPERRDRGYIWPPDPYIALAKNHLLEASAARIELKGQESSISGMRIDKLVRLVEEGRAVEQVISAHNVLKKTNPWGLWFNTRVPLHSRIFVPVDESSHVRKKQISPKSAGRVNFEIQDNIMSIDWDEPAKGAGMVRGKFFIQRPAAGWIAAVTDKQVFFIEFPLHAEESIHPEHAQVELYVEEKENGDGIIELERHTPYVQINAGDAIQASERWRVLPRPVGKSAVESVRQLQSQWE